MAKNETFMRLTELTLYILIIQLFVLSCSSKPDTADNKTEIQKPLDKKVKEKVTVLPTGVNTDKPTHLGKTSNFKGDTLISEEDDFHYEKTDSLAYRLVYVYHFDSAAWSSKIIEYKRQEYLETSSKSLTLIQADSILNEWKLRRSHGPQQSL